MSNASIYSYANILQKMFSDIEKRSLATCFIAALVGTGCGAFEENVTFVCQGSTESIYLQDGEVKSREVSNTRRFIAIKERKVGNNECMFWSKGRIVCQSTAKSIQNMDEGLTYQLNIDRESGETSEYTESQGVHRKFRGKCTRYKGPNL